MTTAFEGSIDAGKTRTEQIAAARRAERDGRIADAEVAYNAALAADPASSTAALGLVRLLDRRGDRSAAERVLRALGAASDSPASRMAAARQWEAWEASPAKDARVLRVAVTGVGTLGPLAAHLRVACAQAGLHPVVHVGEFNQWAQELLAPDSALYLLSPDVIVLLLSPEALFPHTMSGTIRSRAVLAEERRDGLTRIEAVLDTVQRQAPRTTLVMHTFATPDRSPFGVLDLKIEGGQRERLAAINLELADRVRHRGNVVLLDQERIEARFGKARVRDPRMWYLGSLPFSAAFLPVLAAEHMRVIRPLTGLVRKCIVLDLDNTLWGGVIGEDGIDGIALGGNDAPGNAFYDFQLALDGLRRRGILLAIASKNNPDDAWLVIDTHPHMVLRREHFAATRIDWNDKASNLVALAAELNLGLDSLVFCDDNPAERALVRQQLPEVMVVDLPEDPTLFPEQLLALDVFESLAVTDEDRGRAAMYRQAEARASFAREASPADVAGHLASLEMSVVIERATSFTIPRIAQLVNKTNQFNLTTRRHTEAQVRALAESEGAVVYGVTVSDRFGNFGLTGVAIVHMDPEGWLIDSFLLSCRILGRGVEDALLAHIASRAAASGARTLRGIFRPTAKNVPARDFYPTRGFRHVESGPRETGDLFELELEAVIPAPPSWLAVRATDV